MRPEGCICTNDCPETDNPCWFCAGLDIYDPCPVIGFGCGDVPDSTCECCTPEQRAAARDA